MRDGGDLGFGIKACPGTRPGVIVSHVAPRSQAGKLFVNIKDTRVGQKVLPPFLTVNVSVLKIGMYIH